MGKFQEYLEKDKELADRMIIHAFSRNPNISSYPEFEEALTSPDPSDDRIKHIFSVIDDYNMKDLWESESCKARVRQNVNENEFNRSYAVSKTQEVIRAKPLGKKITSKQFFVVSVPKPIRTIEYKRTIQGKEVSVKSYQKSYSRWKTSQIKFLQIKKTQGVLKPKEIVYAYQQQFKATPRPESSIRTKFYRLK
jgi:hypothetical protein